MDWRLYRGERVTLFPCPKCGGPTHPDADSKRRRPAIYCKDWQGCGWSTSRSAANFKDPRGW